MLVGKGHLSAIGGVGKKEFEENMKRKVNKPKLDLPPPPELNVQEETTQNAQPPEVEPVIQMDEETQKIEQQPVEDDEDEFQYFYDLRNRKLVSETTVQITLRLPIELNNEVNRLGKGAKKGWKQRFITKAIEKEVTKLKEDIKARKAKNKKPDQR